MHSSSLIPSNCNRNLPMPNFPDDSCGVLISGGLDSAVMTSQAFDRSTYVQPIYIQCGLIWELPELTAARRFWQSPNQSRLRPIQVLTQPMDDVYGDHWAMTGVGPPTAACDDIEVFLPGRNLLLIVKAALWCQQNRLETLAIGTLATSPFADAKPEFFSDLQSLLRHCGAPDVRLVQPFGRIEKRQVMELGRDLPLDLTFSCIAPVEDQHCGTCNKCGERQRAFREARRHDSTFYARQRVGNLDQFPARR